MLGDSEGVREVLGDFEAVRGRSCWEILRSERKVLSVDSVRVGGRFCCNHVTSCREKEQQSIKI